MMTQQHQASEAATFYSGAVSFHPALDGELDPQLHAGNFCLHLGDLFLLQHVA